MAKRTRARELLESAVFVLVGVVGVGLGARSVWPKTPSLPEAPVVTPPEKGFPEVPRTSERVADYTLFAKLDPINHVVEGHGTITLKNRSSAPLSSIRLHLYLNAFKNDRTVFRRARVSGFRGGVEGAPGLVDVKKLSWDGVDLWPKHSFVEHTGEYPQDPLSPGAPPAVGTAPSDETDVMVPLGERTLAPGESASFEIEFHDELPEISERTGYHDSFHFVGQWFPKLARLEDDGTFAAFPFHHLGEFAADFGRYDVTLDVPATFTVGATGARVEQKVEGGRRIERYQLDDVHDFAFTAWDRYVLREAREGEVAIHLLSPPGYEAAMDRELLSVAYGLRAFGARYGAYPYADLTVVHPPEGADEAGGMEYPTLITSGGPWFPEHGTHEVEGVTVHELGHQWFYGMVATHEVEWPAGDEGLNSYAELGVMQDLYGEGSAARFGDVDLSYLIFQLRGAEPDFEEPVFQPTWAFANGSSYGSRVYGATAIILETLRRTYPRFDAAIGVYARRFRFEHPTQQELFEVIAEVAGDDCAAAARAALTQPGTLDVYVDSILSEKKRPPTGYFDDGGDPSKRKKLGAGDESSEGLGYANAAWIGRKGAPIDLPIEVELRFGDGTRRREIVRFGPTATSPNKGAATWRRLDVDGPQPLVAVIVDPDLRVPMDRTRLDNFATREGHSGGAPVTRERALAWLGVLARSFGP